MSLSRILVPRSKASPGPLYTPELVRDESRAMLRTLVIPILLELLGAAAFFAEGMTAIAIISLCLAAVTVLYGVVLRRAAEDLISKLQSDSDSDSDADSSSS